MRGEYSWIAETFSSSQELPPRARRIQRRSPPPAPTLGTTSACAENTAFKTIYMGHDWNYLRVRGEYQQGFLRRHIDRELPPRARRIRCGGGLWLVSLGTTSACAENTRRVSRDLPPLGNYLRVRGEYLLQWLIPYCVVELPPRARRIPHPTPPVKPTPGTTSACAENTSSLSSLGAV